MTYGVMIPMLDGTGGMTCICMAGALALGCIIGTDHSVTWQGNACGIWARWSHVRE